MRRIFLYQLCILSLSLTGSSLAWTKQEQQSAPDIELLEFLGEWETDDGEWVNPMSLYKDQPLQLPKGKTEAVAGSEESKER